MVDMMDVLKSVRMKLPKDIVPAPASVVYLGCMSSIFGHTMIPGDYPSILKTYLIHNAGSEKPTLNSIDDGYLHRIKNVICTGLGEGVLDLRSGVGVAIYTEKGFCRHVDAGIPVENTDDLLNLTFFDPDGECFPNIFRITFEGQEMSSSKVDISNFGITQQELDIIYKERSMLGLLLNAKTEEDVYRYAQTSFTHEPSAK